jgi:ABC transporter substrate binding protein
VRRAACVAVVAARPGTFKMRPTVTYRADESLMSERMGPVFDWQTVASLDHLVVRRDGGGRMGCLIRFQLPAMFIFRTYVEAGGLMSYGVDLAVMYQRAASYVAKILRGAQPADLPVDQADKFHFALNLKAAKALGITLPTSILLRADEVIE